MSSLHTRTHTHAHTHTAQRHPSLLEPHHHAGTWACGAASEQASSPQVPCVHRGLKLQGQGWAWRQRVGISLLSHYTRSGPPRPQPMASEHGMPRAGVLLLGGAVALQTATFQQSFRCTGEKKESIFLPASSSSLERHEPKVTLKSLKPSTVGK